MDSVTRHVEIQPDSTIGPIVNVHQDVQPTGLLTDTVTKHASLRLVKTIRVIAIRLHSLRKVQARESVTQAINFKLFHFILNLGINFYRILVS